MWAEGPRQVISMPEASLILYLLAGALLFAIGFYSLLVQTHVLRRIMALNVMGVGVFLLFTTLAARTGGAVADPVPHAMVLTGIVVSVCATGLALALAHRLHLVRDDTPVDEEAPDR